MTRIKECPTRIVSDLPADKDAFGSHERVAKAITDLVRTEPGGKTIGMQGGWGSGKSTVVSLMNRGLASESNLTTWIFDAWAHQGDPLRRTFLESLISHLISKGWVDRETWTARREELARRRKVTETTNIPQLKGFGKLLIVLLFLVPVGFGLFSKGVDTDDVALWGPGALLMAGPLGMLAWPYVWGWLGNLFRRDHRPVLRDETHWAIFTNNTITNSRTETIENPEPTSVEFEDTFTNLMGEALSNGRRMVLILDNLDRVDPGDALSIWSTLQTFLQHGRHDMPAWFEKMWLLIPHDPAAIRRLWADGEESGGGLAESFLDKTFQVRFEVPPPVLSDWREYLIEQLKEALPGHGDEEFHEVYRVFALSRSVGESPPTPRALKLYVNDIGAIHRQWHDRFPLSHVAYYVGLRQRGIDTAKGLLNGEVPSPQVLGLLGHNVADSLAALYFNVDAQLARQLLLREPIRSALTLRQPEELRKLADNHPEGFWEVLEGEVGSDSLLSDQTSLANVAACLDESSLLDKAGRPEAQSVVRSLRTAASGVNTWAPFNDKTAASVLSLCDLIKATEEEVRVQLKAVASAGVSGTAEQNAVPPETWADAVIVLVRGLKQRGLLAGDDRITAPADLEGWVAISGRIAEQDPDAETWSFLKPEPALGEIAGALADIVGKGAFSKFYTGAVDVTAAVAADTSWGAFTSAVSDRLQASNSLSGDEAAALLTSLWRLKSVDNSAEATLNSLATGGHILHHFHQAATENKPEAMAFCMLAYLQAVPSASAPPEVGNSQAGYEALNSVLSAPDSRPEVADAFTRLLILQGAAPLLFVLLDAAPQSTPFVVACLRIVARGPEAAQVFTPDIFVARWQVLAQFGEEECVDLAQRLLKETSLSSLVRGQQFEPSSAGLYQLLIEAGATSDKAFREWCLRGLQSVGKPEWLSQLQHEGDLLELAINLQGRGVKLMLSVDYQDALVEHAKLIISGSATPSGLSENLGEVLKPLSESARTMFRRRLYDALIAANGAVSEHFFALYGDEVADPHLIAQKRDAPYLLFTPLLAQRNAPGLRWVADRLESNPELLDRFDSATVVDFRDRVTNETATEKGDDADEPIRRIAAALAPNKKRKQRSESGEAADNQ